MNCGCGGGGQAPPDHPSDSYHWQGGGGITTPPELPTGDALPILETGPGDADQPDRAPALRRGRGRGHSFPWGLALVVVIVFLLVRR